MVEIFALAVFGLIFGSFVNALVWRVHKKIPLANKSRSRCVHCHHELAPKDLMPLLSWLLLRGRCRYCGKPISWQYPLVELAMAGVFVLSYLFWPSGIDSVGDWTLFLTWLAASVGLLALFVYDFRWMLLPNKILYPTAAVAAAGRLAYIIGFEPDMMQAALRWLLSVAVASGIFWLLFTLSSGKWIGYGDVRLGLVTGTLLASPELSLLMIFIASVAGTLFVLPALVLRRKAWGAKLPFGPYLIIGTAVSLLFGNNIIDWYKDLVL